MKMFYYRAQTPNFGDELNTWLWPRLLDIRFDDDDSEIFLGIGSTLYDDFPAAGRKIVFGAGYAGYTAKPDVHDGTWDIHFVRGPQTAEVLNLPPSAALTDPAVLVRAVALPSPAPARPVSFMPHFDSIARGRWQEVCDLAGIRLIDPTQPVDTVLAEILASELLITEAMHGAIVADALRIPWIPLLPIHAAHRFKWLDWTRSVEVAYNPAALSPSSARELWVYSSGYEGKGRLISNLAASAIGRVGDAALIPRAAQRLQRVARREPCLSHDHVIERLTDRVLDKVEQLQHHYGFADVGVTMVN